MRKSTQIPASLQDAGQRLRISFQANLKELGCGEFIRAWCAVAYLFPTLHPDEYQETDGGWPCVLKRFAAEAWRRADAGQLADEELYASDSQWSGLFDRMSVHLPEETERRVQLAATYGE
jgi:hypothetical protein